MTAEPAPTIRIQPQIDLPKPPAKLHARGKRLWQAVVADYVLDPHDLETLEAACEALDQAEHHRCKIKRDGSTFKDFREQPKAHPSCAEYRAWLDTYRKMLRELALSAEPPDSRPASLPRGYK